jgi:hypothetical protein
MAWIPGFEVIAADRAGGTYDGSPWRLVLHSTEGGSVDGAVDAYRSHGGWPTFTVDPVSGRRVQHYDTDTAARALAHPSGTPATNNANAVQVEIVGYAERSMPYLTDSQLDWLGGQVVAPIRHAAPFALTAPRFVPYPDSYGAYAPQRFPWPQWSSFGGVCGHEHVPGNDHGDPGAINIDRVLAAARGDIPHPDPDPDPDPEDWPVTFLFVKTGFSMLVDLASGSVVNNAPQLDPPIPVMDVGADSNHVEQAIRVECDNVRKAMAGDG